MISDFQKNNGTLFVSHENIDQVGCVGTYQQWFDYLSEMDCWYQQYLDDHHDESPMSFPEWIEFTLNECLSEASEYDIANSEKL